MASSKEIPSGSDLSPDVTQPPGSTLPPCVWRVDVRERTVTRQPVPDTWERLGGRGLSARILLDEVDATCDPLGASNKLIYAPGLLVGHMLSSTD